MPGHIVAALVAALTVGWLAANLFEEMQWRRDQRRLKAMLLVASDESRTPPAARRW